MRGGTVSHLLPLRTSLSLDLWYLESSTALLLAVNRCIDLVAPSFAAKIGKGNRTWLMCMIPVIYAILMLIFAKGCIFTSIYVTCSFNPHIGYIEDIAGQYLVPAHTYHNFGVTIALMTVYGAICLVVVGRMKRNREQAGGEAAPVSQVSQNALFVQVFVISAVNVIGGVIYDLMIERFIEVTFFVSVFSTFMWLSIHGTPGVVYLTMNKSVRKECAKFLGLGKAAGQIAPTVTRPSEFTLASRATHAVEEPT